MSLSFVRSGVSESLGRAEFVPLLNEDNVECSRAMDCDVMFVTGFKTVYQGYK
jgi:hypothetical protein